MEKLSSMKPVPGDKKVGDCCCKVGRRYTGQLRDRQTWLQFYKWEEMNSINDRSISIISIEGKSLGQMIKRMVGEHLQREAKIAQPLQGLQLFALPWTQEKQITPNAALCL